MLVHLIYVSSASVKHGPNYIKEIQEISKKKNSENNISGILCYSDKYFLQCIEGPSDKVNALYKNIISDDRNELVTLIEYSEIESRNFENWDMAYFDFNTIDKNILFKHSSDTNFNPYKMNAKQCIGFLKQLATFEKIIKTNIKNDFEK